MHPIPYSKIRNLFSQHENTVKKISEIMCEVKK